MTKVEGQALSGLSCSPRNLQGASHLLQLGQEAVQGLVRQLAHLKHGDGVALQVLTHHRDKGSWR